MYIYKYKAQYMYTQYIHGEKSQFLMYIILFICKQDKIYVHV